MRKLLLFGLLFLATYSLIAQKKDIQKTQFEVKGVCGMCKARIEKTAYALKGVKSAQWDIPSHQFMVLYDANKVALDSIHAAIARAGHDTPLATAPDAVYDQLPMCCLYTREEKKDH